MDGQSHLAWGAIDTIAPDNPAVAAVHALKPNNQSPDAELEFSVAVVDGWQKKGIARLLTAALLVHCKTRNFNRLEAYTLAENQQALEFLKHLGASFADSDGNVMRYTFGVSTALQRLAASDQSAAMEKLLSQLGRYADDA